VKLGTDIPQHLTRKNRGKLPKNKKEPAKDRILPDSSLYEVAAAKESISLFGDFTNDNQNNESNPEEHLSDIVLIVTPKESIEQYMEVMQSAGLKLTSIEIKALSLYRLLSSTDTMPQTGTYLVLDINASASDLSIFHNGQLKITRSVPFQFHSNTDFSWLCNDFAHELERLMNFYRYSLNHRNEFFERVIITGDIDRLSEVVEYLKTRLTILVQLMRTDRNYGQHRSFSEQSPAYSVPLGLALRGRE
jgi:Tfp pilus assembly PilM family ATPase